MKAPAHLKPQTTNDKPGLKQTSYPAPCNLQLLPHASSFKTYCISTNLMVKRGALHLLGGAAVADIGRLTFG